jgi:hypothetical protein
MSDTAPGAVTRRRPGTYSVAPTGYGAIGLTGRNMFGPPEARAEAVAVLWEAVDLGVDQNRHFGVLRPHGRQRNDSRSALAVP